MKSLTNLRKGLALVLCAAMLMGDTTMLQAAQVESTTVGAIVSESKAETEVAEDVPTEEVEQEQEEAEVVEPQAEATEVSEAEEKSEETQVEAHDVETALENKALEATYTATVGETTVTVVAPEGAFTEEVTLQVTEVEITDEMQAQLDEQAIAEQKAINSASAYDISFVNAEGKEIEPAKEVQVSIATAEVNSGDDASVYHFDEEKATLEDMEATVAESGDVAFDTEHFSTYVIVNRTNLELTAKVHGLRIVDGKEEEFRTFTTGFGKDKRIEISDFTDDLGTWSPVKVYNYNSWDDSEHELFRWSNEENLYTFDDNTDTYEVWVNYALVKSEPVTFWDYDVAPITGNHKDPSKSINCIGNYDNDGRPKLTVGTVSQNTDICDADDVDANGVMINKYNGTDKVFGLVKGQDASYHEIQFNVDQPGIFTTEESVGKTVFNQGEYKLEFKQYGEQWKLYRVLNTQTGNYTYAGGDFFPLDDATSKKNEGAWSDNRHNFYFGLRYDVDFTVGDYDGPMEYFFSGDDDLWVLLDGKVVEGLDIGGIHDAVTTDHVDLRKTLEKDPDYRTKKHHLTVLYMERGANMSNCTMEFTIPNAKIVDYTNPVADFELTKVDGADKSKGLAGAKFKLQNTEDADDVYEVVSGEDGKVLFTGLSKGTYTLTEEEAPKGYIRSIKKWTVTVVESADKKSATATVTDENNQSISKLVVENTKNVVLKDPDFTLGKTVAVDNYDNRTYKINLTASSTTEVTTTVTSDPNVDVMLVLDTSASMNFKLNYAGTYGELKDSNGKLHGTYYAEGIFDTYEVEWWGWPFKNYHYGVVHTVGDSTRLFTKSNVSRIEMLKPSVEQFLKAIAKNSPQSKVGIVTFSSKSYGNNKTLYNLQTITSNAQSAINSLNQISVAGGTSPELGLALAEKQLFPNGTDDGRKKVVILFTDGEPTGEHGDPEEGNTSHWDSKDETETAITALRNKKVDVYTVGFALTNEGKNWLQNSVASKPEYANTAETQANLETIFARISQQIMQTQDLPGASVIDVIDPRFELTDAEKTRLEAQKDVTVSYENGKTIIRWENQTLPYKTKTPWTRTIEIKAKDNFLGGNAIPTNVAPDSKIIAGGKEKPFPQPTANVKVNLSDKEDEETLFIEDMIQGSTFNAKLLEMFEGVGTLGVEFTNSDECSMDYVYPGTNGDKVGTLTFKRSLTGEKASWTDHEATIVKQPAEIYTITVTYEPYSKDTRMSGKQWTAPVGAPVQKTTATAKHTVNVVEGVIKITKQITSDDYKKPFGDPVFTFKIYNETKDKTYYRTLRFTANENGKLAKDTLTATVKGLPSGKYTVSEMDTLGFKQIGDVAVTGTNAKSLSGKGKNASFTFEVVEKQTKYEAATTYVNKLNHSKRDTDTDVSKNHFHVEKDSKKNTIEEIKTVDNDVTSNTGGVKTNN